MWKSGKSLGRPIVQKAKENGLVYDERRMKHEEEKAFQVECSEGVKALVVREGLPDFCPVWCDGRCQMKVMRKIEGGVGGVRCDIGN